MGKKLKTLFHMYLGFSIGILSSAGYVGYKLVGDAIKEVKDANKRFGKIVEINNQVNQITAEGAMLHELKDRKQYLKTKDYKFDLDDAEILKYHKGDDRLVVYIRDIHGKKDLQGKTYETIDELQEENGIDLLVLENLPDGEVTKEYLDPLIDNLSTKVLCKVMYGFWKPDEKDEALKIFDAGATYEYVNGDKIKTYGAEDEDLHDTAVFLAYRRAKSEGKTWLFEQVVLNKRSEIDTKNTIKRMTETGEDKAIFICGAAHTKGILETLEDEGVSYLVLQPKGMDKEIEKMLGYF